MPHRLTSTTTQAIVQPDNPNDIYVAYANCIRHYTLNPHEYGEIDNYCFLHDIDGDTVPELWIVAGDGECCKILHAYSYVKSSGKVKQIFEGAVDHSAISIGDNFILRQMYHMGVEHVDKISYNGKEVIGKRIFEAEYDWDEKSEEYIEHVILDVVDENMPIETTKPKTASLNDLNEFLELWNNEYQSTNKCDY